MKKILVFLLVVACSFNGMAQSMLRVRVADDQPINVWLDGRFFNKRGTAVTVSDLPYGNHMLRIYALRRMRGGRMYEEMIYRGRITTYDGMITQFYLDPYTGETDVKEQDIAAYNNERGQFVPNGGVMNEGQMQPVVPDAVENNAQQNSDNMQQTNDNMQQAPVASPMSTKAGSLGEVKMGKVKEKVDSKKIDTDKMNAVKEALNDETFNTDQVGRMMDWFNFESSRVEFAEWAYDKTVDKELYGDLGAKFTYENYRNEFEKFLSAQK